MKCPLYYAQLREQFNDSPSDKGDCLEEECAWWGCWTVAKSEEQAGCCLPVLATIFSEIMSKTPEGGKK